MHGKINKILIDKSTVCLLFTAIFAFCIIVYSRPLKVYAQPYIGEYNNELTFGIEPNTTYEIRTRFASDVELVGFFREDGVFTVMATADTSYVDCGTGGYYTEGDRVGEVAMGNGSGEFSLSKYGTWTPSLCGAHQTIDNFKAVILGDAKIFANRDEAVAYIDSGDTSGQINKPPVRYDTKHDFSKDTYNPDIPLPQLSNVSHYGFTVSNLTDGLYMDIATEYVFYGKKVQNSKVVKDSTWKFKSHDYDFTKTPFAVNQPIVLMSDMFGIDPFEIYWGDWESWTMLYPTIDTLSGFKWYDYLGANAYNTSHVINNVISAGDMDTKKAFLHANNYLQTTYYVRFYDENMEYGQWMRYVLSDEYNSAIGMVVDGTISAGAVSGTDSNGNAIVNDSYKGEVGSDGNINYDNGVSEDVEISIDEFNSILNSFSSALRDVPAFVRQLFSFLPWWIQSMLFATLAICCVLRILGR